MINLSSTTFQVQRRRFPLKPRSVRTPPAKFTFRPATDERWETETITLTQSPFGGITLDSSKCSILTKGRNESLSKYKTTLRSFYEAWQFFKQHCDPKYSPQLHEQRGEDTATISLRYKVPAEPARKVPTRLSPKLRP
jgi:hypothetical protein